MYNIQSITIHIIKLSILEYQCVDANKKTKYSDCKSIEYIICTVRKQLLK